MELIIWILAGCVVFLALVPISRRIANWTANFDAEKFANRILPPPAGMKEDLERALRERDELIARLRREAEDARRQSEKQTRQVRELAHEIHEKAREASEELERVLKALRGDSTDSSED